MNKITKGLLLLGTTALTLQKYNDYITEDSSKNNLLKDDNGFYYNWNFGKIYYTINGSGKPLLLIHDIQPTASSFEWERSIHRLSKSYKVFTIDLPGCGRSEKPEVVYTTYMYVQILTSFIKDVIKEKTNIAVSNLSYTFVLKANQMNPELFDKLILINPTSISQLKNSITSTTRLKKLVIDLPIIGTFFYNINTCPKMMDLTFRKRYSSDIRHIDPEVLMTYYESAHLHHNKGKYLYSSILGNYMYIDIYTTIKSINKKLYILYSENLKKSVSTITEFYRINKNCVVRWIPSGSPYPQIEDHIKVCKEISSIII